MKENIFKDKSKKLYNTLARQTLSRYNLSVLKKMLNQDKKLIKVKGNYFHTIYNEIKRKGKVLDIGCGYGRCMYILGVKKYVGIDISKGFLKIGRKLFPSVKFIQMDARQLKFKEETFDSIFMFEIIEHLLDYKSALKECYRVLKKNGTFIITTPNKLKWIVFPLYYILPAEARPWGLYLMGRKSKKERDSYLKDLNIEREIGQKEHVKMFSPNELKRALIKEGFIIKQINKYGTCLDGRVPKQFIESKFYKKILKRILPCESFVIICRKNKLTNVFGKNKKSNSKNG